MPRQLRREHYTVGWVCALPVELAAAKAMLDERHGDAPREVSDNDENVYCMGSVAGHNVVIVCLPAGHIGNNPAAAVATQMQAAFKGIRFGLMVGIGGGVPSMDVDVRLGDVVVSQPQRSFGGVVQYDFGKTTPNGLERIGSLNSPPQILLSAVNTVRANALLGESTLAGHVSVLERISTFQRCKAGPDVLFEAAYNHERGYTCDRCNVDKQQSRAQRDSGGEVVVHSGTIASGNQVIKSAAERDRLSEELGGVLCFEMEAAGLMNSFPCLVIRGISDYADSHKNHRWQAYAAATAAAYAKELLSVIPAADVMETRPADDAMSGESTRCLQSSYPDRASNKRKRIDTGISKEGFAKQRTVPRTYFPRAEMQIKHVLIMIVLIHQQDRSETSLNDATRQALLDSLKFEQIDARQMTIRIAPKTCRWLLTNVQYLEWLDPAKLCEHHGFLWIKGNAGTGKSALMKYAWANACRTMRNRIVLSFFFNARGEDIEKSTIGTYRSLLLQLLDRVPALQSVFDSLGLSSTFSTNVNWSIEPLKMLFKQAIQALGQASVVCFIDALDECEQDQIREMIQYFEQLGDLAVSSGIRFQVCFSSRHYPHVTIRNGLELVLEGQEGHAQDITSYIKSELKIGQSKIAQQIRVDLQEKASGIFMWVVLVVGILNKEFDDGQVHRLRQKLKAIPSDLHELFRDILTRDSHNKDRLVLCIQWVLFAKQPLSPKQLYHALLLSIDPDAISEWDSEETTKDDVKRFLLNASKGLTEATISGVPRVQFIHESVRDFLLKENGLSKIWPEYGSDFESQSYDRLKQCCLAYISIDVATPLKISDLPKASSPEAAALRESATQKFPLLEHAVRNILYYADTAEGGGFSQANFLDSFPLPRWIKLDNLFKRAEVRRHTQRASLLYLLAELNMANLMGVLGSVSHCMDIEAERYGCPLFAAAATSSERALELCMNSIEMQRADSSPATAVDDEHSQHKSAQRAASRNFVYSKSKDFLLNAAELGHDGVLALLIRSGRFNITYKDSRERTALWWASRNACEMSVRLLLAADPDMVHQKDKDHKTALFIAAEQGDQAMVALLLEGNADINAPSKGDINALNAALDRDHKEVVMLLLNKGANVNAESRKYSSALQAASAFSYKEIITLLLDKGANVNAEGGKYGSGLQAASAFGHKEIVTLLLDKGANVNAEGGFYGSALLAASALGYKEIVTLLLDKGANVNAEGGFYGSALQAASAFGHKEIVTLLLDKGANVNAKGGHYGSGLQAATARRHKEIVTLLLDKGAGVNAQGRPFGSALQAASP